MFRRSVALIQCVIGRGFLRRPRPMTRWGSLALSRFIDSRWSFKKRESLPAARKLGWSLRSLQARKAPVVVGAVASDSIRCRVWRHTHKVRVPPDSAPFSVLSPPPLLQKRCLVVSSTPPRLFVGYRLVNAQENKAGRVVHRPRSGVSGTSPDTRPVMATAVRSPLMF